MPTVESYGGAVSYERGAPVHQDGKLSGCEYIVAEAGEAGWDPG